MDEVLEQFNSTCYVDTENEQKSGYDGLYKNWGRLGNQDQRRRDILDVQKSNRNSKVDTCRGILELVNTVKEYDQHHRKGNYRPNIYVSGFTKAPATYRDVLMMSEWMVEKPEDFEENWYVVPCPKGVRTLVVACQGDTKCYNKYGFFRLACRTALPGGNPCDPSYMSHCVVLDCFHVEALNTLYVLDVLAWNNQPMTDGETDFRNYWMKSHIEEIPELKSISKKNKIKFEILPKHDCSRESFNKFMMTFPHFKGHVPSLDGLLFYHKMAHYVSGATPLVGWLYPFMVNEILGTDITVNRVYAMEMPVDYVNQAKFIQDFENKINKKSRNRKQSVDMEISNEGGNDNGDKKRRQRKTKQRTNDADMAESSESCDSESVIVCSKSFLSRPKLQIMDQETAQPTLSPGTNKPSN